MKELIKKALAELGFVPEKKEEQISYEVIYEPDTPDAHGEWMSKEEIEKACENFNKNLKAGVVKANFFHLENTDLFEVVETWVHKELDVTVDGTNEPLKAGTWVAKIKYKNADLWELKKGEGFFGGVSFCGMSRTNPETGEMTDLTFDGLGEENDGQE